jgi:Holliday junction resolvase RusA-like endonuclease
MKHTLVIQGRLDGLNEYTKACRSNKYTGNKLKKENEQIVSAYIMQQLKNVHFDGVVRLSFRWYEKDRKRDIDNIAMSKKFILDALVTNKVIKTDGWKGVVGFTDEFFIDKTNPHIEVDIEEVK